MSNTHETSETNPVPLSKLITSQFEKIFSFIDWLKK